MSVIEIGHAHGLIIQLQRSRLIRRNPPRLEYERQIGTHIHFERAHSEERIRIFSRVVCA